MMVTFEGGPLDGLVADVPLIPLPTRLWLSPHQAVTEDYPFYLIAGVSLDANHPAARHQYALVGYSLAVGMARYWHERILPPLDGAAAVSQG